MADDPKPHPQFAVEPPFYPIVYVRGFAATAAEREDTFHDAYYGYAATAVEKRRVAPPRFFESVVFEGQLIRFMKEYGYVDAANGGLGLAVRAKPAAPTRSLWVSRFYDPDVMNGEARSIEDHARDLHALVTGQIPQAFADLDADAAGDRDFKVILIAHSMGGLVCRCLIQKIFADHGHDATKWVHRLVTIGTPHGGIDLGAVPDFLEDVFVTRGNALGAAIFREPEMRRYLALPAGADVKSLNNTFPEGRCLCVVGSDHASYGAVRKATGNYSDGLVRQDRAYIDGAYRANVHRAHSGRRGIVNSFETYENVRRFLFGNTRVELWLDDLKVLLPAPEKNVRETYDFEFSLTVRGTGVVLHQRAQNPCENGKRLARTAAGELAEEPLPGEGKPAPPPVTKLHLHTGFLDTTLRPRDDEFSHFLLAFRVVQHQVKERWGFDREYPERTVYSESLEVRVKLGDGAKMEGRWLSDAPDWKPPPAAAGGVYRFDLRPAATLAGALRVHVGKWPDGTVKDDARGVDAPVQ